MSLFYVIGNFVSIIQKRSAGILVVADALVVITAVERKGEKQNMEKFINNAPFALVLVLLVIGFVLLIKGADYFVEGSSSVAKRLHVPSIIIGLTIVAMGTSLPETAVSSLRDTLSAM